MTLKEKYLDIVKIPFKDKGYMYDMDKAEQCEQIADEFAIEFAEWICKKDKYHIEDITVFMRRHEVYTKELALKLFKKEKGL